MGGPTDVQPVLVAVAQPAAAAATGRRGHEDQAIADQAPHRVARIARERGGDEGLRRALQERDLLARARPKGGGIVAVPVGLDERALAQIADPAAAPAE